MQDHERQHRSSTGFIAGIIAAMVTAGTVSTWWAIHSLSNYTYMAVPNPRESPLSQPSGKEGQGQVYWLKNRGDRLKLQESPLTFSKSLTAVISLCKFSIYLSISAYFEFIIFKVELYPSESILSRKILSVGLIAVIIL